MHVCKMICTQIWVCGNVCVCVCVCVCVRLKVVCRHYKENWWEEPLETLEIRSLAQVHWHCHQTRKEQECKSREMEKNTHTTNAHSHTRTHAHSCSTTAVSFTALNKNVLNSKTACHMKWKSLYVDSSRYIIKAVKHQKPCDHSSFLKETPTAPLIIFVWAMKGGVRQDKKEEARDQRKCSE